MAANRFYTSIGRLLLVACVVVMGLMASEHHGSVKSGGLPVPGATVTATQGDKKVVTTTDESGLYSFPELADGVWTISIDMLGFEKVSREIGVAVDAPNPTWDLKMQSLEAMTAPPPPPPAPAATAPATTATAEKPSETKPAEPAATATKAADTTKPAATTTTAASNAKPAKGNTKNSKNSNTSTPAGNNGNPSLTQALGGSTVARPGGSQQGGFQRIGVNQSSDLAAADAGMNNDISMNSDIAQGANDAFTINGSVSQGLTMPGQGGDWGPGRGGDMGGMGPGGMMMPGMNGMPGDPTQMAAGGAGPGGGGRGGGGPGGGGPGGGFAGGGRGGGGGMGIPMSPGGGGRGGRGGGRGGPGGRGGTNSFGNNRRDPRSRYNFSASGILTNSALNARNYSVTGQEVSKPNAQSLRSTLTAGGPLKIPHLLTSNKGTFTINYTLGRARTGTTYSSLVPTDAEKAGNFAGVLGTNGLPVTLYNGATPYPNNQIPLASISPIATALLKYYPEPNFTGSTRYNFASSASGATNSDNVNARLSYTFNTKNQVNGGLQYQRSNSTQPSIFAATIPAWHDLQTNNGVNANANYIYHFNLHVIATTRYNYSKSTALGTPYWANVSNVEGALGIVGTDQLPLNWGPPSLSFSSGILGLSDANARYLHPQTSAVGETVLWVRGAHQFQFGADFSRRQTNSLNQNNPRGTYSFTGAATALNGLATNTGTGYDFADFLLGSPGTMALNVANSLSNSQAAQLGTATGSTLQNLLNVQNTPSGGDRYLRTNVYDLFVNDQWQISPRLSLSLGVRWDYQAPSTELYNRLATIDLPATFAIPTNVYNALPASGLTVVAGGTGPVTGIKYGNSMLGGQKTDFSPRLGFAWKPFAKRSTVVRGGYGIQFSPSVYSTLVAQLDAQAPFATEFNLPNNCHATLQNGLSLASLTQLGCVSGNQATTTNAINPNFRVSYAQLWQLAVQQNLKWNMVTTVTYFASKGTALTQQFLPNSYPSGGSPVCASGYTCPSGYTYETSNGDSTYNSVQAQLNRRTRAGLGWNVSYSLAKSIDDASGGIAQNWQNLTDERGRTAGVRNQSFNGSLNYSTGVGTRGGALINGWKGVLLKDWMLTTNMTVASGAPITPGAGRLLVGGTASANIRAYYNDQPAFIGGVLNSNAFTLPPAGQYGNIGRDALNGPGQFTMSANANRTFRLADRKNLTFSLQTQNPLNHPNISSWNTTVGNAQFGLPQNYVSMRTVTATMRFNF
ncbi:MAG: TonB-dependent receptor [Bryobacteraceae bacterium]|jgi:hypothetical protein